MKIIADDFGLSRNINDSVIELARNNKISGVSVMVNRLDKPTADALSATGLQIGLHLEEIILNTEQSVVTQLKLFFRLFNKYPDFIDGHRHIHAYPFVASSVIRTLLKLELQNSLWIRSCIIPHKLILTSSLTKKPYLLWLNFLGIRLSNKLFKHNIKTNKNLWGVFAEQTTFEKCLNLYLKFSDKEDILFCHPSLIDEHQLKRQNEFFLLSNLKTGDDLESNN